jgi:superfamily II DNA or RNA helicase
MKRTDRFIRDCKSWDDFFQRNKSLPSKKEQGDNFERVVQLYLQVTPQYNNLTDIWAHYEVPADVRRKINLPRNDEGLDGIARDRRNRYWAIQTKFRGNPYEALTIPELSTARALAFNTCRNVKLLVIAHTCMKSPRKRYLMKNTIELGLETWREMDWSLILKAIKGEATRPAIRQPYNYQQPAVDAAQQYFKTETRGRLIMPCATGKSLIGFWIGQKLKAKNIIVVVPSLGLLRQTVAEWAREFYAYDQKPDWICVCSDEAVGNLKKDETVGEVYQTALPTDTDPREIAKELRRGKGPKIVFVTYHSSSRLAKAARLARFKFDLIIFDEAHRTAGPRYRQFATLLHDGMLRAHCRVFMTATERKVNGDAEVCSMDDNEEDYGKRFFTMSYKEAIRLDAIVDYKILTVAVSEARIAELIATNRLLNIGRDLTETEARQVATGLAIKAAIRKYGIKKALSFHSSIKGAEDFCNELQPALNKLHPKMEMATFHVNSAMDAGERAALLKDFKNTVATPALMTNARCLTEGIDIPAIDCVIYVDPKQSYVDIIQAAGRAMRKSEATGKKLGYLLLPLVIPEGMEFKDFAETTAFNEIARIISALSVADNRIVEELKVTGTGRVPKKYKRKRIINLVAEDGLPIGLNISLTKFADAISVRAWEKVARMNWRPFEEARKFAHSLKYTSVEQWREFAKSGEKPLDIPANPPSVYPGWVNWLDWLGTERYTADQALPFEQARAFVHKLKLANKEAWTQYCASGKRPVFIPSNPAKAYSEWTDWPDWLGNNNTRRGYLVSFEEARDYARGLGFTSHDQWEKHKKPNNIPRNPGQVYEGKGWKGWADFLGTERFTREWAGTFEQAREYARSLNLPSVGAWIKYWKSHKRPIDIPSSPQEVYADKGWAGWADFLGTAGKSRWRPFREARAFARTLGFTSREQWAQFIRSKKRPKDLPMNPERVYKEWRNWFDWLDYDYAANGLRAA